MFPKGSLASSDIALLTFYISVIGAILLAGVILKSRLMFLKRIYMPASLVGGAIGLVLGYNCLNILPKEMTTSFAALPSSLIVVVFAPMLLCADLRSSGGFKEAKNIALPQMVIGTVGSFLQIGFPCLVAALLLQPFFGVHDLFPSTIEIGWAGGHGTASGMVEVFETYGWAEEGSALGLTQATIGLVFGIVGGMIIINHGIRNGYISPKNQFAQVKLKATDDVALKSSMKANSYETISNRSVESFAFHLALIGVAIILGYLIKWVLGLLVSGLPLFPMAMLGGLVLNRIIIYFDAMKYVDQMTLQRIQGICLDIMVVAAIASIKLSLILANLVPIMIISVASVLTMLFFFYWICPRVFNEDWFEQALLHFGVNTGVTAVGFMLLRTVDPEMKTISSKAYAIQAPFTSPFLGGGIVTALLPLAIMTYGNLTIGIASLVIAAAILLLARILGCWHKPRLSYT